MLSASGGLGFIPGVSHLAQPAVRGRRASRIEQAGQNVRSLGNAIAEAADEPDLPFEERAKHDALQLEKQEKARALGRNIPAPGTSSTTGGKGRRASVLLADAVASDAMGLPAVVALVHAAVTSNDGKAAAETVASLGHLAMRANADAVRAVRPSAGVGHHDMATSASISAEQTLAIAQAGAIEATLRALNRMYADRELVLRCCWALDHILQAPANRMVFLECHGRDTLRTLKKHHAFDYQCLSAITEIDQEVSRMACSGSVECCQYWGVLRTCSCLPMCCQALGVHLSSWYAGEAKLCACFACVRNKKVRPRARAFGEPLSGSSTGSGKDGVHFLRSGDVAGRGSAASSANSRGSSRGNRSEGDEELAAQVDLAAAAQTISIQRRASATATGSSSITAGGGVRRRSSVSMPHPGGNSNAGGAQQNNGSAPSSSSSSYQDMTGVEASMTQPQPGVYQPKARRRSSVSGPGAPPAAAGSAAAGRRASGAGHVLTISSAELHSAVSESRMRRGGDADYSLSSAVLGSEKEQENSKAKGKGKGGKG